MKILVLQSEPDTTQLPYIAQQLGMEGEEFCFIGARNKKPLASFSEFGGFFLRSPFTLTRQVMQLAQHRTKKFSVLVLPNLREQLLLTPWARLMGYRVIWWEHAFVPPALSLTIYVLFFKLWSRIAEVYATSHAIRKQLKERFKLPKVSVIERGIDIAHLRHQTTIYEDIVQKEYQTQNNSVFTIGYIGKLDITDGVEYLITAIAHFSELIPDYQVIIVGEGSQKKSLIWLTKTLGVDHRVRFVGNQQETERWYNYLKLLVIPHIEGEAFCDEAATAISCGIPVVYSDVPGVEEIIRGQGGLPVDPGNAQKLADSIFRIYRDQELSTAFSQQGKLIAEEYYSLERLTSNFKKILTLAE